MTTNEKRREVAATMMSISCRGVKDLTLGEVLNSILTGGAPRPTTEMDILARLADLIDRPTCENGGRLNERTFLCSACGYEAHTYSDSDCNPHDFSYCPECGSEVVS